MEFDGETIRFNIFEAIRYPTELHSIFVVFFIDALAQQLFEITGKDGLEVTLSKHLEKEASIRLKREVHVVAKVEEALEELECTPILSGKFGVSYLELPLSNEKLLPSVVHALTLELKLLSEHLKYIYLGEKDTLPVIIAKDLSPVQDEKLIWVLRKLKMAIGWTIVDIKGISPSMCMH